jgi:hypothetical protein
MSYRLSLAVAAALFSALAAGLVSAPAHADSVRTYSCFGSGTSVTCVKVKTKGDLTNPHIRTVPEPESDEDEEAAEARDKRWVRHCRPVIRPDAYGVPTYHYARPGCEYGRVD